MEIRKLRFPQDIETIKELCERNGLQLPDLEYCLVAVDEKDGVIGFVNVITIPTVDCFIAEEPIIARRLYDTLIGGFLSTNYKSVQFYTKREDLIKLYERMAFRKIGDGYTIARKDF